ncbi:MAG: molecular chaperone [Pseudaminobacter sp.]
MLPDAVTWLTSRLRRRRQYVDQVEVGIIVLTKVIRIGPENAISVVGVAAPDGEATTTEIPEVRKERSIKSEIAMY